MPSGLDANVECVEPGGNTFGLISSSRAQMPASGLRPFVSALPNTSTSGCHAEMLDRPQLAGAEEAHLDLVDDEQDAVLVEHPLQLDEEVRRRNHVAAGALDRLDVERRVFALAGLRVPHAVVFGLEQALELRDAVLAVFLLATCPSGRGSGTGIDELRAIAKWP